MASEVMPKGLIFIFYLIALHTCFSSGTLVGFYYDAREANPDSWSPQEALTLLQKNNVSTSLFRIFLTNQEAFSESLQDTNIPIDLFVNRFEYKKLLNSVSSATMWLETHLIEPLISTIIVSCSEEDIPMLVPNLNIIRSAVEILGLEQRPKVSPMFSLPTLEKNLPGIIKFIGNTEMSIFVETFIDEALSLGEVIERAVAACSLLPGNRLVLYVKSSVIPSGREIADFIHRFSDRERILQIFVEISPLLQEKEIIFPTSHRELTDKKTITIHDTVAPITFPSPDIITIPSTNPTNILPTTSPITIPSTNPTVTPITVPATNPIPTPVTNPTTTPVTNPTTMPVTNPTTTPVTTIPPVLPVTNPAFTPTTNPMNPPVTNPATYPFPPPSSIVPVSGTPSTVPVTGSGQSWCVAKSGVTDNALQMALDYACGIGTADCSAIQTAGTCYNPNSLQAHASYAFNSYYQKNPVPTSCDFGGVAMIVSTNPSTGTCTFPSSSSASSVNPASNTGGGIGSTSVTPTTSATPTYGTSPGLGPSVLNPNNSDGSSTVFGSNSPTATISSSLSLCVGWTFLILPLTANCFTGSV